MTKRKKIPKVVRRPLRAFGLRDREIILPGLLTHYRRWPSPSNIREAVRRAARTDKLTLQDLREAKEIVKKKARHVGKHLDARAVNRVIEQSLAHVFFWAAGQAELRAEKAEDNPKPWSSEKPLYLRVAKHRNEVRDRVLCVLDRIASGSPEASVEDPSCSESLLAMYQAHFASPEDDGYTDFEALDPHAIAAILERTGTVAAGGSAREVAKLAADGLRALSGHSGDRGRVKGARDGLALGIARYWLELGIKPGRYYTPTGYFPRREGPFARFVRILARFAGFSGPGIEGLGDQAFRRALKILKDKKKAAHQGTPAPK